MNLGRRGAQSLYCKWRNAYVIVSAALVSMALWIVAPSVTAYIDAESNLISVQEYEAMLLASRALSAERGPSNVVMSIAVGSDPAAALRLREARRATDMALSAVDSTKNMPIAPGVVRSLREQLSLARGRIDLVAQMPQAERSVDMLTDTITGMFGIVDEIQPVVFVAAQTLAKRNTELAGSVFTALIVTDLREQAGRLASHIVPGVSRGQPLPPAVIDRVNRTQGSIDKLMQMLGLRLDISRGDLHLLMGEVRRLFIGQGVRLIEKLTLEGRTTGEGHAGAYYSVAPAGLTDLYVPTLVPLEDLRKATIDYMLTDIVRSRNVAFLRLVGMAAATMLLLTLLVAVMRRLFLSVLRPLLTAHEMIVGLAEERPTERQAMRADTREINDLFDAIGRLEGQLAERRDLTERLRFQAETDPLTGLLNRSRFLALGDARFAADTAEMTQGEMPDTGGGRAGKSLGVLYIDLDGFKAVNDTFGHFAGDELLREISFRLSSVAEPESLLARLGGDEFAFCTLGLDMAGLEAFASRILLQFNTPIDIGALPVQVGASIGLALVTEGRGQETGVSTFSQLCCNADMALYDAKRNGRNTYRIFGGDPQPSLPEHQALTG